MTAAALTPANAPDGPTGIALLAEEEPGLLVLGDGAYGCMSGPDGRGSVPSDTRWVSSSTRSRRSRSARSMVWFQMPGAPHRRLSGHSHRPPGPRAVRLGPLTTPPARWVLH